MGAPAMQSDTKYVEDLFQKFQENPGLVPDEWRYYFQGVMDAGADINPAGVPLIPGGSETPGKAATAQNNVSRLMQAYRTHGHRYAYTNPLANKPSVGEELALDQFGLDESQLEDIFATDGILSQSHAQLKDILTALQQTYCGPIGVQIDDVSDQTERRWLRERMEEHHNQPPFEREEQHRLYHGLMIAGSFEKFLHTKYVGVKRFSIEGGEALIPMLDTMVDLAGQAGMTDVVLGMAHRGRLNVLVNIMAKPLEQVFAAFNEKAILADDTATGDVKYHMGKSYDVHTKSGHKLHMSLLNNPSHLEAVNPVVMGSARAKQERLGEEGIHQVLPLLIHGDSAFAGQGVVPESLNLANLKGYTVGGTIHVVINNQVGFTAEPEEVFSGEYCTDIARMLQIPIFHVNGDDPQACAHAMEVAFEYRRKFNKDVVIDLVCYRKYGHNEGDDPTFTQPQMYAAIKGHSTPAEVYKKQLLSAQSITEDEAKALEDDYQSRLQDAYDKAKEDTIIKPDMFGAAWQGLDRSGDAEPSTKVTSKNLTAVAKAVTSWPKSFTVNPKVAKGLEQRSQMLQGKEGVNWGAAEMAAYATLLQEGFSVRLSGQDVQRGTFTHRHAVVVDQKTGERKFPVQAVATDQANLAIWNSSLSEFGVLGYEFGYSLAAPNTLTVWEAQFGDFANGAQIMIDQFIASSEVKWQRMSGLVMLLPHGFEGQGPEHSSARLERYLQLCGDENMTVAMPTTPAQIFHLLRRQMHRKYRKPLVVMSPKSLLRSPAAVSDAKELTNGHFQTVIPAENVTASKVNKVVLCSGKVYYDLAKHQAENKIKDVALVRLEQLYPLDMQAIKAELKKYGKAKLIWCQEEPRNQGSWTFVQENLAPEIGALTYVGRAASASPAVGSHKRHSEEQQRIVAEVFKK